MSEPSLQIALSAIDEERFGIRTARATHVSEANLPDVLAFCAEQRVQMLISRSDVNDIHAAQAQERAGFELMDTLVYYARDLHRFPIPDEPDKLLVRMVRDGEDDTVRAVAAESFKGYFGHYHADRRLESSKADEAYQDWAQKACVARDERHDVFIAEREGAIVGFATMRINSPEQGEGVLFGVHPAAQGQGLYRSFMIHGMRWCIGKGAKQMVVSTQLTNLAVQKVWVRVGFEPSYAYYTFHKWFA